ncbi:MAG: TIGR00300 family protein [Spirochaetales bacterium]|nr:TIGR00300 family protein [Spirochaetales bacterium]
MNRKFISTGHLIDSGILSSILNLIIDDGADYQIVRFDLGKEHKEESYLEIEVFTNTEEQLASLTPKLVRHACYEKSAAEAVFFTAEYDKCAPDNFYSTTNHRTEIFKDGKWHKVLQQRMDASIVLTDKGFICRKLRDIKKGDKILTNAESVRVFPPTSLTAKEDFGFMSGDVSSERASNMAVKRVADTFKEMKDQNKKVVVVAGPVVIHTGGGAALASLIKKGYISGLLAGNALAVHDVESQYFGTSLGVDLKSGKPTHEGHKNHMKAINRIYNHGSIKSAIEAGDIVDGLMYAVIKSGIPYCLAGSIRDDGPLPETENDMIKAQTEYAEIIKDASVVLMLSTMLHSIGTGNMLPSWVKTVCVDINPAVVTKLSDRGSSQTIGIVSDVGLFLNRLDDLLD